VFFNPFVEILFELLTDCICSSRDGDDDEVAPPSVSEEILLIPVLCQDFTKHRCRHPQALIAGDEAVDFFEAFELFKAAIEQCPLFFIDELAQFLLDDGAGGETCARINEALPLRAGNGVLNPQLEFFNVEGFGDVIVGAKL